MRKPVTVAAVIGFKVGMYWIFAGQPSPPSEPAWGRIMRASCPPIAAERAPWWLVPLLNAVLYAVIRFDGGSSENEIHIVLFVEESAS
jgi:hypothetical protein